MSSLPVAWPRMTLEDLKNGEVGVILRLEGDDISRKRLMAFGFISGKTVTLETRGPLGDPKIYSILGYRISVPNSQARNVIIRT
ncbi:MAG: feoA [Magnetococcales bacterium]|nr:feoA [Magnetococcales bacterium]